MGDGREGVEERPWLPIALKAYATDARKHARSIFRNGVWLVCAFVVRELSPAREGTDNASSVAWEPRPR